MDMIVRVWMATSGRGGWRERWVAIGKSRGGTALRARRPSMGLPVGLELRMHYAGHHDIQSQQP